MWRFGENNEVNQASNQPGRSCGTLTLELSELPETIETGGRSPILSAYVPPPDYAVLVPMTNVAGAARFLSRMLEHLIRRHIS